MGTFRIAHISDLHAAEEKTDAIPIINAALDDLEAAHKEAPIDLVAFTGDLADRGKQSDYEVAETRLIEPLFERLELTQDQLALVPGNHDVDRDKIDRYQEGGLGAALTNAAQIDELLDDSQGLAKATERLAAWNEFYETLTADVHEEPAAALGFTRVNQTRGLTVGIASLNTAWRCSGDDDKGRLLLGERQYRQSLDQIKECDLRIVLMHHPLSWLLDFDANNARTALEDARSIVLCGHEHLTDPTGEFSLRGAAIYSRAGCLYERPKSLNGFTLIDVDLDSGQVRFSLRAWYEPPRKAFDQATGLAKGGQFTLDWGNPSPHPVRADYSTVLDGLATRAAELCVLVSTERQLEVSSPEDVLVEPRLWPVPYKEIAAARNIKGSVEPEPLDPVPALERAPVLVVSGEPESGVSGALLWTLSRHFELKGTHTPLQASIGKKLNGRRFEKILKGKLREVGQPVDSSNPLPPSLIAIDDLTERSDLKRLASYIAQNDQHLFILGTHDGDADKLTAALSEKGVTFESLYLGPLGRAQVRKLIELTGGLSETDVDRIFGVVVNQHLPRTPLLIAALILVLQGDQNPASFNPSALLDGCVKVLLTMDIGKDPLEMDLRQREVLLSWFAGQMVRNNTERLTPLEADEALARYFRDRGLGEWQTPGQAIESHIARRILVSDGRGVGFRHKALLDLFSGNRLIDDRDFAAHVVDTPLQYEEVVSHAAGLRRDDKELLAVVTQSSSEFLNEIAVEFDVQLFDRIKDRQGWSEEDPDFDDLKAAIARRDHDVDESERDEQLERFYDDVEYDDGEYDGEDLDDPPERLQALGPHVSLLSGVLRNSELVADVDLKESAFREAIHGWSMIAILYALEEDQSSDVRERMNSDAVRQMVEDEGDDIESLARVTELILVMLMVMSITASLASPHLEMVAKRVLDDKDFMRPTAHAMFATLYFCLMRFGGWVDRLAQLYEQHSEHPIVKELVISVAVSSYRSPRISDEEADQLGKFLAGLTERSAPKGSGGVGRGLVTDSKLAELRKSRQKKLMSEALKGGSLEDDLIE